jgi:hypothetical protein
MITLKSGKLFDIFDPDVDAIDVEEIAHSLALQCRYGGHCNKFYSVAEHSFRMAMEHMPPDGVLDHDADEHAMAMACLLHDAAEAYIGDIVHPLKKMLRVGGGPVDDVEERILVAVYTALGVPWPSISIRMAVERDDRRAYVAERALLMPPESEPYFPGVEGFDWHFVGFDWSVAKRRWLEAWERLSKRQT